MCEYLHVCVLVSVCVCHCEWVCYRKLTRESHHNKKKNKKKTTRPGFLHGTLQISAHTELVFSTNQGSVLKPSPASEKWLYSTTAPWGSVLPASPGFNMTYTLFALPRVNGLSISC